MISKANRKKTTISKIIEILDGKMEAVYKTTNNYFSTGYIAALKDSVKELRKHLELEKEQITTGYNDGFCDGIGSGGTNVCMPDKYFKDTFEQEYHFSPYKNKTYGDI
jgi:hypothetical protein